MKPTGLKTEEEIKNKISDIKSPNEMEAFRFYRERIESAKKQRDQAHEEFDGMNYYDDYVANKRAVNSFLRPKLNDDEVRVNTGVTEKKIETVINEVLNLNLQSEVRSFDKNDIEVEELGKAFEDVIKRTNEIEKDEDIYKEMLIELVSQRALFIEEIFDEKTVVNKIRKKKNIGAKRMTEFDTENQIIKKPIKRLIPGLRVYLGDITIPAYRFHEQPYIIKYERMNYDSAKTIYGSWAQWNKVLPGNVTDENITEDNGAYRMHKLNGNDVEIIKYESAVDDDYMIIINGVLMLEPGTQLPYEKEGYMTDMIVLKSMSRTFAYGKPLTASAKYLQALNDEIIRNLVRKFQQAIEPPLATKNGKGMNRNIWEAGAITSGISSGDFERLIDHTGVTQSELAMKDLIDKTTEEFIGATNLLQGQTEKGLTATQAIEQLKQGIKSLGFTVLAAMRLRKSLDFLRIYNVLENYAEPIDKELRDSKLVNIYRSFTVESSNIDDNKTGIKRVVFTDEDITPDIEQFIFDYEEQQEELGITERIIVINIKKLRMVPIIWYITVIQSQREGNALDRVIFQDELNQAVSISVASQGEKQINWDTVEEKYNRTHKTKNIFKKGAPMVNPMPQGGQGGTEAGKQLSNQPKTKKPSINTLLGQG